MSIKVILVPVSGATSRSPLELAVATGRKFGAHLDLLHVRPDPRNMIPYVGEGMSGALIEEVMTAAEREAGDRAVTARALFERYVTREGIRLDGVPGESGVSASWREDAGREDEAVAVNGRFADLIVVSRPLREAEVPTATLFEAALFEAGQPLLVAPPEPVAGFGRRIMIGWNGSMEAARAVTAGLPFLKRAETVWVVSVAGWGEGPRGVEAVARRLAWHGVQAEAAVAKEVSGTVGEQVLAEATRREADMIVMGAYTQSRLRQMILGGVTRHVLSAATVPLLMAH